MSIRIPLAAVVLRHFQTYGDDKGKAERNRLAYKMIVLPFILSIVISFLFRVWLNSQATNALVTVMAVFVPLLFTALISLHDTRQNLRTRLDNDPSQTTKYEYLLSKYEHLADNVSFILAMSIIELILLFIMICAPDIAKETLQNKAYYICCATYNAAVFFLLQIILYHLVFIIERLASLIKVTSK